MLTGKNRTALAGLSFVCLWGCDSPSPPAEKAAAVSGKVTILVTGMGEKLHLL